MLISLVCVERFPETVNMSKREFILLIFFFSVAGTLGFDSSCQTHYTIDYNYEIVYKLPKREPGPKNNLYFKFSLLGPSDGHLLLSESAHVLPTIDKSFEVVIGAGKNTFSQIRPKPKTKNAHTVTVSSPNILSSTNMTTFILKINKTHLAVYQEKALEPLMSYNDPFAEKIKFVSFSAWRDVAVLWQFDCKVTTEVVIQKSARDLWISKFLTQYDPQTEPTSDDGTVTVDTTLDLRYINLDAKKGEMTTYARFNLKWVDLRLKWNPKEFHNLTSIDFPNRAVWQPRFVLFNGYIDQITLGITHVSYDGVVTWSPFLELRSWCGIDLSLWPNDRHLCPLQIGVQSLYAQLAFHHLSSENPTVSGLDWIIEYATSETTLNLQSNDTSAQFRVDISLKRCIKAFSLLYILPVVVIMGITLSGSFLPPSVGSRLALHSITLVLLTIYLLAEEKALPAIPKKTPAVVQITSVLHFITAVLTIVSAFVSSLTKNDKPPPDFLIKFLSRPWTKFILLKFVWEGQENNMAEIQRAGDHLEQFKLLQWLLVTNGIDRIAQILTVLLTVPLSTLLITIQ